MTPWTKHDLIAFERGVADLFNAGKIRAPVHLSGGNEDDLIRIFQDVKPEDWVVSTWRSHYHCLLKGVPPDKLLAVIMAGQSITLCFPEERVLSSAIVAGGVPIAIGLAAGIKRAGGSERVWVFVGDMAAFTGSYRECWHYARGHGLPISFVVEDNGKSVCTDTMAVMDDGSEKNMLLHVDRYYFYELPWPHAGAGVRVQF